MSNFFTELKKRNLVWVLVILFTVPTFFSIIRPGLYTMHDDIQAFRVFEMDKCFQDLQIPCRWVPDMGYQYGYPQFNYYPPSIYYLAEIFHLIGFQFIDTVKIIVILGFLLSALFMYFFLQDWLGEGPGVFGAVLYTFAPYKAVNAYVRGALSEFWALVFYPLIFWSILKVIKEGQAKHLAFFAISIGLLLTTHNLMSFTFLPVAGIFALTLIILEKKYKAIFKLLIGGLLGLGLAAFFTLPVLFERDFVHLETIIGGYFDYRAHFANLNQLFISNYFGYGSSELGPRDELSLSTGQVHWILASFAVILAALNFKKQKKLAVMTLILAAVELFVLFMIHQKSSFIWSFLGFLEWLQFPWRLLSNSIFLLSTLGAIAIYLLDSYKLKIGKNNFSYLFGGVIVISLFILHLNFFHPNEWLVKNDQEKFSGKSWEKQLTISIFDYLPIYAKFPPITKAPTEPEVLEGSVKFLNYKQSSTVYKKGSNFQLGEIEVLKPSILRLPLFDFPGMKVFVDGQETPHKNNDCRNQEFCLGLINFQVVPGKHTIYTILTNTPIRTMGNTLTVSCVLIVAFLLIRKKNEKNII